MPQFLIDLNKWIDGLTGNAGLYWGLATELFPVCLGAMLGLVPIAIIYLIVKAGFRAWYLFTVD